MNDTTCGVSHSGDRLMVGRGHKIIKAEGQGVSRSMAPEAE